MHEFRFPLLFLCLINLQRIECNDNTQFEIALKSLNTLSKTMTEPTEASRSAIAILESGLNECIRIKVGAAMNHTSSLSFLASIHFNGHYGIARNTSQSFSLYKTLSLLKRSSDTFYHLGVHYAMGLGTSPSPPEAIVPLTLSY